MLWCLVESCFGFVRILIIIFNQILKFLINFIEFIVVLCFILVKFVEIIFVLKVVELFGCFFKILIRNFIIGQIIPPVIFKNFIVVLLINFKVLKIHQNFIKYFILQQILIKNFNLISHLVAIEIILEKISRILIVQFRHPFILIQQILIKYYYFISLRYFIQVIYFFVIVNRFKLNINPFILLIR